MTYEYFMYMPPQYEYGAQQSLVSDLMRNNVFSSVILS